ncbi:MAG: hypothetical protein KDJ65_20450 [Anaerolineae bacterium]|nr:hypothetical protein [Anaerolineae bacterium]
MKDLVGVALKLHTHIVDKHWNGQALFGPDPGVRYNYRIFRFLKSYLRNISWNDDMYYLQAQSYWSIGNWALFTLTGDNKYRQIAVSCSEYVLERQRDDGAWDYPNPEWKGRTATVEGTWAALGLLETYRHTKHSIFLDGALRWHKYMIDVVGFQKMGDELAVNYFANMGTVRVTNNSTTVLSFLAELADATGDETYLEHRTGLINFIQRVQMPSGELPYGVGGESNPTYSREHFQCYQYNAFECLSLLKYYELTQDEAIVPTITNLLSYLSEGVAEDGHAYYNCDKPLRTVTYHATALAATFVQAKRLGFSSYDKLTERAYGYVLSQQKKDGFVHSRRDYGVLSDQRSYPRYLSMIMYHLLFPTLQDAETSSEREQLVTETVSV